MIFQKRLIKLLIIMMEANYCKDISVKIDFRLWKIKEFQRKTSSTKERS